RVWRVVHWFVTQEVETAQGTGACTGSAEAGDEASDSTRELDQAREPAEPFSQLRNSGAPSAEPIERITSAKEASPGDMGRVGVGPGATGVAMAGAATVTA